MFNDEGVLVDLYLPRKCSWTNKLITAKDFGSVQINIGHLDENGVYTNSFTTYALSGPVRFRGEADSAIDKMWTKDRATIGQSWDYWRSLAPAPDWCTYKVEYLHNRVCVQPLKSNPQH